MKNEKYIPALGYDLLTTRERKFKKALIKQANFSDGQSVLDLACGTGTLAVLIKKEHPQTRISGIDGDAKILAIARRKSAKEAVEIEFDEGMSFALPYPDKAFERVVSSLFFHHLTRENKLKTLREVFRVLKPKGEIHIADWGKPQNFLMQVVSRGIELLDGAENTADNFQGLLPSLISQSGFQETLETRYFNSLFGTIRLLQAKK